MGMGIGNGRPLLLTLEPEGALWAFLVYQQGVVPRTQASL